MTKYKIEIKSTIELEKSELNAILELKQQHWKYDYESQLQWFKKNIKKNDLHLLIYEQAELIAYLNAVWIDVEINSEQIKALGIGNVCVALCYRNIGFGQLLMATINSFLKSQNICGFLLCKDALVAFYEKSDWKVIVPQKVTIDQHPYTQNVMGYHLGIDFSKIEKLYFSCDF